MFDLTGTPLLVLATTAAVLALLGAVAVALLRSDQPLRRRLVARALPIGALVLVGQLLAMSALALGVNDQYVFYSSWADLTGHVSQGAAITTQGLIGTGEGQVRTATMRKPAVGRDDRMMVWLPPQYSQPAYAHHRFPVVMFLSGQPSSPQTAFHQFAFGSTAAAAIAQHKVQPFVAVFPTLMVDPPRDTECTDIPNGPQAESWLARDVPAYLTSHYRVAPLGLSWTVMGWSTGGFCATKLVAGHPQEFGSAVSFGGYYQPLQDHTTGSLFAGRRQLMWHNSPQWLYLHGGGLQGSRLLMVAGKQDRETWSSTASMIRTTAGDSAISHIAFPEGGHNYRNYAAYVGPALAWSSASWPRGTAM